MSAPAGPTKQSNGRRVLRLRGKVGEKSVVHVLQGRVNRIGSAPDADLVLHAAGISRAHVAVAVEQGHATVEDLGSKNGTFVNGERVTAAPLRPGDLLSVGTVSLHLEEIDAADVELGLALSEPAGASSAWDEGSTETRAAEPAPSAWLRALAAMATLAAPHEPTDATAMLGTLVQATGAGSAALLRLAHSAEPAVLASAGAAFPDATLTAMDEACRSAIARAGDRHASGLAGGSSGTVGWAARRDDGCSLAIVACGKAVRDASALSALQTALVLLAPHVPQPGRHAKHTPVAEPELRFPAGFLRCRSAAMGTLHDEMRKLLRGSIPVLITGETGVGKEGVARTLHLSSPRASRPFIPVNCAAIPSELLEAELFGVVRGAATGVAPRRGKLQHADRGTVLLDEIGDMAPPLQAKLLRALQDGEVMPVGADRPVAVDVWVLSATNNDILKRVRDGAFRQDLYYRLAGATLHVPALRQRPDDIAPLVAEFLREAALELGREIRGVSVKALAAFERAPWPGNIRQLRHEVRALALRCPHGGTIESSMLPDWITAPDQAQGHTFATDSLNLPSRVAALEHELIEAALATTGGNQVQAARLLGISRDGLRLKLARITRQP